MMKKGLIYLFVCMLVILGTIVPVSATILSEKTSHPLPRGNNLYVGGSGPNNYTKIQDAINDASDGDTVYVYDDSSPYYENIIIEKSITLIGENRETTSILGDESADGIIVNISADDVSISGFTIQPNMGQPEGIVVSKNYTYPDYWNIVILQNISVYNNIIKNTGYGIFGIRLKYGTIYGNTIENCKGSGILLFISTNTTITNNIVSDCSYRGIEIDGLWSQYRIMNYRNPVPENNTISHNTVRSNRWGIELNSGPVNTKISDNNITDSHETGVQIVDASKTEITRNNFIDNSENAYFMAVMVIRYPRFMLNSWDNNYWGEPKKTPVRINGDFYFIPFPRIPIDISFGNFSLNQYELPWIAFDWHPAQEPYDISLRN
jgi:parallel beta-helix repeat protein